MNTAGVVLGEGSVGEGKGRVRGVSGFEKERVFWKDVAPLVSTVTAYTAKKINLSFR